MTRTTPRRLLAATVLALVAAVGGVGAHAAADDGTAQVPAAQGWARFGHFAPSAQPVDVLVDGQPFATDVAFKGVSDYLPLAAGLHTFEVRPTGDPSAAPLLSVDASVPADGAVTVGAVTTLDGVAPQVYDDALVTPAAGQASVRFIHSAPDVPAVDVQVVGGPLLAADVPYPSANGYQPIQPGQYDVEVRATGTDDVLLQVAGWSIQPDTQASIVIVRGLDGQLDVVPVRDSAATSVIPVGGIQTGYGGMAGIDGRVDAGRLVRARRRWHRARRAARSRWGHRRPPSRNGAGPMNRVAATAVVVVTLASMVAAGCATDAGGPTAAAAGDGHRCAGAHDRTGDDARHDGAGDHDHTGDHARHDRAAGDGDARRRRRRRWPGRSCDRGPTCRPTSPSAIRCRSRSPTSVWRARSSPPACSHDGTVAVPDDRLHRRVVHRWSPSR